MQKTIFCILLLSVLHSKSFGQNEGIETLNCLFDTGTRRETATAKLSTYHGRTYLYIGSDRKMYAVEVENIGDFEIFKVGDDDYCLLIRCKDSEQDCIIVTTQRSSTHTFESQICVSIHDLGSNSNCDEENKVPLLLQDLSN